MIAYAGWAQLFFNVFNVFAVRFALRGLTRNERVLWTATLFFVLGNWVGQDYLAPQAFSFALALIVLGLCLRCGREVTDPRYWPNRRPAWLSSRIATAVVPPRMLDDERAAPPIGPRTALLVGGVCYLAIVTSHQLSPVMLTLSVFVLALVTCKVPLWVPAAMAAIELWWVALAWTFLQAHFHLIDPGGAGAAAAGRNLSAALPHAALSFYAPAAVMTLMAALAIVGFVRRVGQGKRDLVPVCLVVAPLSVVVRAVIRRRGWLPRVPVRASVVVLPGCVRVCVPALVAGRGAHAPPRLLVAAPAVSACLLFAFFGQELANRVPSSDVHASLWYEQHAPAGSMRIDLAPNAPDRLTARYPVVDLSDPPALVSQVRFAGHQLGAADVGRLIKLIHRQRARPAYVILSRLQENYARLEGIAAAGFAH